jgi:hypothetical protein
MRKDITRKENDSKNRIINLLLIIALIITFVAIVLNFSLLDKNAVYTKVPGDMNSAQITLFVEGGNSDTKPASDNGGGDIDLSVEG